MPRKKRVDVVSTLGTSEPTPAAETLSTLPLAKALSEVEADVVSRATVTACKVTPGAAGQDVETVRSKEKHKQTEETVQAVVPAGSDLARVSRAPVVKLAENASVTSKRAAKEAKAVLNRQQLNDKCLAQAADVREARRKRLLAENNDNTVVVDALIAAEDEEAAKNAAESAKKKEEEEAAVAAALEEKRKRAREWLARLKAGPGTRNKKEWKRAMYEEGMLAFGTKYGQSAESAHIPEGVDPLLDVARKLKSMRDSEKGFAERAGVNEFGRHLAPQLARCTHAEWLQPTKISSRAAEVLGTEDKYLHRVVQKAGGKKRKQKKEPQEDDVDEFNFGEEDEGDGRTDWQYYSAPQGSENGLAQCNNFSKKKFMRTGPLLFGYALNLVEEANDILFEEEQAHKATKAALEDMRRKHHALAKAYQAGDHATIIEILGDVTTD